MAVVGAVRDRRTFRALRADGARRRSGPVTVTVLAEPSAERARVAYAIGRAVGSAVVRNRVRRRLRAIVRELDLRGGSYLISVAPAAAELSFAALRDHVRQAAA